MKGLNSRLSIFNIGHITAGFSTVLVGYTSSIVIIIQVATASGVTDAQLSSWLLTLGVMIGISTIGLSWFYKTPVLTAWSTPGAAMLVGLVADYTLSDIVGAFVVSGALITLTGMIKPLTRALERIPAQLGTAMLAAILLPFCLRAFEPISTNLTLFLCMFVSFLVAKHIMPRYVMLVLLLVGIGASLVMTGQQDAVVPHSAMAQKAVFDFPKPVWVMPTFDWLAIINLSIPLYLVTMLSQNLPGVTVLKSFSYQPAVKPILVTTGALNTVLAGFGGFSLNLAAISAAICMGEEVDKDKGKRYRAALWAGTFYFLLGLFATTVVAFLLMLPMVIVHILAGLALLGTLLMCLQSSFTPSKYQEAALFTFIITLSGVTLWGVSSTMLGLCVGLIYLRLTRAVRFAQ